MLLNLLFTVLLVIVVVVLVGQLGLLQGQVPRDLGVRDGKLKPLPSTPNAVSSQFTPDAAVGAQVAPLDARGLDPTAAMATLAEQLRDTAAFTVIVQRADYIYGQAQSRWLHFVDDVEFAYDAPTQTIAVRSASRMGRSDFGVNRQRVESIRATWDTLKPHIPKNPAVVPQQVESPVPPTPSPSAAAAAPRVPTAPSMQVRIKKTPH